MIESLVDLSQKEDVVVGQDGNRICMGLEHFECIYLLPCSSKYTQLLTTGWQKMSMTFVL